VRPKPYIPLGTKGYNNNNVIKPKYYFPALKQSYRTHHFFEIIISRKLKIDDSQVVEIRQVPWTATPATIAHYFAGLNVYPGGVAIRLTDGRRSNTAIVAFADAMNAQLALARNQHQLCGSLIGEHVNSTTDVNSLPLLTNHIANNNNNNNIGACNYNYINRSECSTDSAQLQQQQQTTTSTNTKPVYLQIHPATGREFVQCTGCK
ncbi:unnamed protein product, partial [Trichobilharzia regenti]